ncbi:hypothetical protein BsWGS_22755 [Bradybaena similaris]
MATCAARLVLLLFVAWSLLVDTGLVCFGAEMGTQEGTSGDGLVREKRKVAAARNGFNNEEKEMILQRHNYFRTLPGASNMLKMTWNPELENMAQMRAARCKFEHKKNTDVAPGFSCVGESLFITSAKTVDPLKVMQSWYDEVSFYNNETLSCKSDWCGHYTQIVWARSWAVGCGVKFCEKLQRPNKPDLKRINFVVCNYGPW